MATHYRTFGFIIKKTDRGEADQFLTVYTKDYGKLKILGKAIRKIASKLKSGAGLFYLSEIEFIQGKRHKTLTDAILVEKFSDIRRDLSKLKMAYQIAETLDELVPKQEKERQIWELLNEVFQKLNNPQLPVASCQLLYYYFFWNLVSILGYQPELRVDSLNGKKIDKDIAKILKLIFKNDWPTLSRLKLELRHPALLKELSEWYNKKI